jgi:hypothetical protein
MELNQNEIEQIIDRKNILLINKRIDENILFYVSFVIDRSYFGSYFKAKNKY